MAHTQKVLIKMLGIEKNIDLVLLHCGALSIYCRTRNCKVYEYSFIP